MRDERAVSLEVRNLHLDTRRSRQLRAQRLALCVICVICGRLIRSVVVRSAASLRSADNTPQLREHSSTRLRRQQGRSDLPLCNPSNLWETNQEYRSAGVPRDVRVPSLGRVREGLLRVIRAYPWEQKNLRKHVLQHLPCFCCP